VSAKVFSIANQKGGTGKTTLSMNFAAGLAKHGRTLVIDADPQRSAGQWTSLAPDKRPFPVSVIAVSGKLSNEIARFRQDYEYLVIDCPPSLETGTVNEAMLASDTMLIPVLPSPIDLWASVRLASAIEQAKLRNPQLQAHLVINQLEPRSALSRAMQEALAEFDIPSLKNALRRRAVYRNSAIEGASVFCIGKQGQAAAQEIEAIIEELLIP